jgi:hypothetical protein
LIAMAQDYHAQADALEAQSRSIDTPVALIP